MSANPVFVSPAPLTRVVAATARVPAAFAYEVAREVKLLPKWAAGLAAGVHEEGGAWYADSPMGRVRLTMAPKNVFGVLDHDVTLPDGTSVHNAFRVTPLDEQSCAFTFLVAQRPGMSRQAFEADVAQVQRDLDALSRLLESEAAHGSLAAAALAGLEDALAGRLTSERELDDLLRDGKQTSRSE